MNHLVFFSKENQSIWTKNKCPGGGPDPPKIPDGYGHGLMLPFVDESDKII